MRPTPLEIQFTRHVPGQNPVEGRETISSDLRERLWFASEKPELREMAIWEFVEASPSNCAAERKRGAWEKDGAAKPFFLFGVFIVTAAQIRLI